MIFATCLQMRNAMSPSLEKCPIFQHTSPSHACLLDGTHLGSCRGIAKRSHCASLSPLLHQPLETSSFSHPSIDATSVRQPAQQYSSIIIPIQFLNLRMSSSTMDYQSRLSLTSNYSDEALNATILPDLHREWQPHGITIEHVGDNWSDTSDTSRTLDGTSSAYSRTSYYAVASSAHPRKEYLAGTPAEYPRIIDLLANAQSGFTVTRKHEVRSDRKHWRWSASQWSPDDHSPSGSRPRPYRSTGPKLSSQTFSSAIHRPAAPFTLQR